MYNFDEVIDRRHMRSAKWSIPEDWLSMGVADMDFRSPYEIQAALLQDNIRTGIYDYQPVNGYFTVPDLPGIGQELSQEAMDTAIKVTVK